MSDERELKLKCLELAGGNVDRAREILSFVRSDEETGRLRSLQHWASQPAVVAMSDMLELLRSGAGCIRPHESDLLVALKWAYTSGGGDESTITHLTPYGVEVAQMLFPESSTHPRWIPSADAALEAPAQPLDELRSVTGAEEEVRDQSVTVEADWPTPPDAETTVADPVLTAFENDHIVERAPLIDAQTCEEVDPRCSWKPNEPDALAEFMKLPGAVKWEGGDCPIPHGAEHAVVHRDGMVVNIDRFCRPYGDGFWKQFGTNADIIAYRILEAPAPEQAASEAINDLVDELVGDITFTRDTVAMQTYMDGDQVVIREISAEEMYAPPPTDLWQQGYDDKLNGYEPSLAEPDYLKGYADCGQILDARKAADEQASFFAKGMMADADRHAKHDGPFAWLRKREDA